MLASVTPVFKKWYEGLSQSHKSTFMALKPAVQKKLQDPKISDKARTVMIARAGDKAKLAANDEIVCYAQIILFQEQPANNTQRMLSQRLITEMKTPSQGRQQAM